MKQSKLLISAILFIFSFLTLGSSLFAMDIVRPPKEIPIVDQTNTLTTEQKGSLAATIAKERSQSSNQIAILVIPSLNGESLEEYSIKVARNWGIGTNQNNNGVLLLVVKNDRKLRIEVGTGLEGALPDAKTNRIIRYRITPEFKKGNYYEGIKSGLDGIILAIHNEYDATSSPSGAKTFMDDFGDVITEFGFFLLFIPIFITSVLARSKSWWLGGMFGAVIGFVIGAFTSFIFTGIIAMLVLTILGLLFDRAVSNNYRTSKDAGRSPSWWAGGNLGSGSSSGSSSGGFGGFGGGSFGGGGSSGSW